MLASLLAYAEFKLGPTWGPAAYELVLPAPSVARIRNW